MRFRRMRYAIWLPLAAKAVACLGAAGATKPLAPTAKAAIMAVLSMITDATAAVCAALALRGRVKSRRYAELVAVLDVLLALALEPPREPLGGLKW